MDVSGWRLDLGLLQEAWAGVETLEPSLQGVHRGASGMRCDMLMGRILILAFSSRTGGEIYTSVLRP